MKKILYVILGIIIMSCDEAVNIGDFVNTKEELVLINSSISPQDKVLKVSVSKTAVSINDLDTDELEALVITDAIVLLSNEIGEEVALLYIPETLSYQIESSKLDIIAGKSYNLRVIVEEREFTATCNIPKGIVAEINGEISNNLNSEGVLKESVVISFKDIGGESNYYVIGAELEDFIIKSFLNFGIQRFATDNIKDGITISSFGFFTQKENSTITNIVLRVANMEPILYNSLYANYLNKENASNPFYDGTIPPTNIKGEGGHGVFGGYQLTEKIIKY
ncbi:hypothetical protein A8C32_06940 [Flavivirga aquatica]|uniref:DUF4249 domain-containing protein n=1 Tax=Flavivirga aquatica TaxID=1849968 RepID=A0A1E5SIH0_9FLAO|nr:DUF4249 family protein [Flavivirga aquatica]OEJ98919.1 hypothetical protein A8C32_06940 [Flavivirga aquatica]